MNSIKLGSVEANGAIIIDDVYQEQSEAEKEEVKRWYDEVLAKHCALDANAGPIIIHIYSVISKEDHIGSQTKKG